MTYTWKANFSDATSLTQFDENEDEVKFGEVEARMDELESFELVGDTDSYTADLVNGEILHDANVLDDTFAGEADLQLKYKRRNQVRTNFGGDVLDHRTTHVLGLTDGDGEAVVEVFPGLEMAPAKIEMVFKNLPGKVPEDITQKIKDKVL